MRTLQVAVFGNAFVISLSYNFTTLTLVNIEVHRLVFKCRVIASGVSGYLRCFPRTWRNMWK